MNRYIFFVVVCALLGVPYHSTILIIIKIIIIYIYIYMTTTGSVGGQTVDS